MRHQIPSPSLPLELVIIIIDFLSGDKAALKHCSLISPTLLNHCRHYLFASVRLTDNIPEHTFEDFATFVASAQAVAHHISSLEIAGSDEGMEDHPPTFLRSSTLSIILHNLPTLYSLSLSSIELQQGHLSPHPLPPLNTLRTLFLDNFIFETDLKNLFNFFASFPGLEALELRELSWIADDEFPSLIGPRASPPALCALRRLTMGGYNYVHMFPDLIQWSRFKISSTSITVLDLVFLTSEHALDIGGMISGVANLQWLRLRLSAHFLLSSDSVVGCVTLLGFSDCSRLQMFSLYFSPAFLPTPPEDYSCESWEFLDECLSEFTPSVRHISIGFVDQSKSANEEDQTLLLERNSRLPWAEIDEKLSAMRQLENITFTLEKDLVYNYGRGAMSPLNIRLIQTKLPQTAERGILRCWGTNGLV